MLPSLERVAKEMCPGKVLVWASTWASSDGSWWELQATAAQHSFPVLTGHFHLSSSHSREPAANLSSSSNVPLKISTLCRMALHAQLGASSHTQAAVAGGSHI